MRFLAELPAEAPATAGWMGRLFAPPDLVGVRLLLLLNCIMTAGDEFIGEYIIVGGDIFCGLLIIIFVSF
jgi:hypothetical protein